MNTTLSLRLEQSNRLLMTPQLRQALDLLQLPALELDGYLETQALENPLLEIMDKGLETPAGVAPHRLRSAARWQHKPAEHGYSKEDLRMEIDCAVISGNVKRTARLLLDSLDGRGFLPHNIESLAQDLQVDLATLHEAMNVLQTLSLPGLGARSVEECVLLQLQRKGKLTALAHAVIKEGFQCLLEMAHTCRKLQTRPGELEQVAKEIKACHPFPAQMLTDESSPVFVVPDLHIVWNGERLLVKLEGFNGGRLRVNDCYDQLMSQAVDTETRQYLRAKRSSALWLINSLQHRKSTLLKVGEAIATHQRPFLLMGVEYLKPLTMLQVAEHAGLHESTVSRAVADKYVVTPQGILPMRFFFDSGVKGVAGELAAEAIKEKIVRAIRNEDRSRPLSDAQLAKIMEKEGIAISRRTVAKYRSSIGVLSSADRRRYDIMG